MLNLTASKARLILLQEEKKEKQNLKETIEHYKRNLLEREEALAEKEKIILELRNTTRTLENFRFVLDNRLQQLFAERGPITSHIEDLESHIRTMYEELVGEFDFKKGMHDQLEVKDKKLTNSIQEVSKLRADKHEKEVYIAAFKRELGNIVASMVSGKELEESIRILYRKYVRGEVIGGKMTKASPEVIGKVQDLLAGNEVSTNAHLSGRVGLTNHPSGGGLTNHHHPSGGAAPASSAAAGGGGGGGGGSGGGGGGGGGGSGGGGGGSGVGSGAGTASAGIAAGGSTAEAHRGKAASVTEIEV